MSITITLYNNKSDNNVVDKDLTEIATVIGTLKEECSIVNPEIFIALTQDSNTIVADGSNPNYSNVLKKVNYFYVPPFERYYYKTDVVNVRSGLWLLKGKSDPLSSFPNDIRNSKGIVMRQENRWNLYIDDGSFKIYNNPIIVTKAFPSPVSTTQSYILAVAGG